jgi:hypothetical protein
VLAGKKSGPSPAGISTPMDAGVAMSQGKS